MLKLFYHIFGDFSIYKLLNSIIISKKAGKDFGEKFGGILLCDFSAFLLKDEERDKAHGYLENRRAGCRQTYQEQRTVSEMLHQQRDRDPYAERSANPLKHNKRRFLKPVVISDKAEQEAGEQAVDRVCLEVTPRVRDCRRVLREDTRQQVSTEEGQREHRRAEQK